MTRSSGLELVRVALIALLVVVLALGLLYAYRAQTPAVPSIPRAQAVTLVQSGSVRSIVIEESVATLTLVDGTRRQTTVAGPDDDLVLAAAERGRSDPAHPVEVRFATGRAAPLVPIGGVLLSVLPLLLLAALVVLLAYALSRARRGDVYQQLARVADLRDRGVLTEDELQREKRRLLH